jgi:hypothetical protein
VKDSCLDRPLALSPMLQVGSIINTSEVYSIEHASNVASSQPIIEVVTWWAQWHVLQLFLNHHRRFISWNLLCCCVLCLHVFRYWTSLVVSTLAWYSADPGFKSRHRDELSWQVFRGS